jgi:hypothetical protein
MIPLYGEFWCGLRKRDTVIRWVLVRSSETRYRYTASSGAVFGNARCLSTSSQCHTLDHRHKQIIYALCGIMSKLLCRKVVVMHHEYQLPQQLGAHVDTCAEITNSLLTPLMFWLGFRSQTGCNKAVLQAGKPLTEGKAHTKRTVPSRCSQQKDHSNRQKCLPILEKLLE